ncbi:MAG: tetratricopeptide repeat protein [Duncaniella sp.]|nr:tetratricopeptide repeat protein [Duncaniella sp.]
MANTPNNDDKSAIEEVNDSLTGVGVKIQNNPKVIVYACVGVAIIVAIVLIWIYAVRQPGMNAAANALGQADIELMMGNDSVALDKFRNVADEYGYKSGDIAALNAAIILYKDKKYEEALTYLKKYSTTETIIGAGAKSLEGDCYVNLKQYPQALDAFKAAVKVSDNNPYYTPVFLMKQATVLREMKDYKAEAAIYEQILKDYPKAPAALNVDIEKYLQRAKASEAK